jgi:hypothetical protein
MHATGFVWEVAHDAGEMEMACYHDMAEVKEEERPEKRQEEVRKGDGRTFDRGRPRSRLVVNQCCQTVMA